MSTDYTGNTRPQVKTVLKGVGISMAAIFALMAYGHKDAAKPRPVTLINEYFDERGCVWDLFADQYYDTENMELHYPGSREMCAAVCDYDDDCVGYNWGAEAAECGIISDGKWRSRSLSDVEGSEHYQKIDC